MSVQPETLRWLLDCPTGDVNFKSRLAEANIETCQAALLSGVRSGSLRLGSIRAIERRMRALRSPRRERGSVELAFLLALAVAHIGLAVIFAIPAAPDGNPLPTPSAHSP